MLEIAIETYAKEKLQKIDKYIGEAENVKATVVINVKNHNQKVEVTIPLKTFILRAEETSHSIINFERFELCLYIPRYYIVM